MYKKISSYPILPYMIKIAVILMLLIFSVSILAVNHQQLFEKGVRFYDERDFSKALQAFLEIENDGVEDYELFYNLGNTYFRLGNIGKAILYYKRGLRLNPNDFQLRTNLEYAMSRTTDRQIIEEPNPILRTVLSVVNSYSIDFWALLSLLFFIPIVTIVNIIIIFYRRREKTVPLFLLALAVIIFLIPMSIANYRLNRFNDNSEAVMITSSVPGYSGPDSDYTHLFTVNEGLVIEVLEEGYEWSKIAIPIGTIGWVRNDTFKRINPDS